MSYASVSDIEARWRDLDTAEEARATTLLSDVGTMLTALVDIDPDDAVQAELLKSVSCSAVIRAMSAASDSFGASQMSMTAGPYSQSFSYANPSGDLYFTKLEKKLLGIATGYIGSMRPVIDGVYGSDS